MEALHDVLCRGLPPSWISCFGVPDSITMDRGPAFLSELWVSLARSDGHLPYSTTACSSWSGQKLKRTGMHSSPGSSWVFTQHQKQMATPPRPKKSKEKHWGGRSSAVPTRPYRGPHRVIRRAPKAFLLDIHGREVWVTADRLKPASLLDNKISEETGRRPRVPPQQNSTGTAAPTPKRGPGRPRKQPAPAPEPEITPTPRPQFSRSRGLLQLPQHLRD
ncbi:uncharacterized protein [Macrobrachium rosenbergii]|uniref:uncharacterized protein n=1 Tax=Macrobrachium rosenbergii TaxID=79674 RepID=UPI0034D7BA4A